MTNSIVKRFGASLLWLTFSFGLEAQVTLGPTVTTFSVLGGSTVTNTGPSVITGNLGLSPGSAITGFPPATVVGVTHDTDATAAQAQIELTTAYNSAAAAACTLNLTGQNLGGLTLTPGVYCFNTSAQLTGTLTLNAVGDQNAQFIFKIGSTLTTASGSTVVDINNAQPANIFWQVGAAATLGTTTAFSGNILALTSITLNTGATLLQGRALARNGAVTLDTNTITIPVPVTPPPPPPSTAPIPSTFLLALTALALTAIYQMRERLLSIFRRN